MKTFRASFVICVLYTRITIIVSLVIHLKIIKAIHGIDSGFILNTWSNLYASPWKNIVMFLKGLGVIGIGISSLMTKKVRNMASDLFLA